VPAESRNADRPSGEARVVGRILLTNAVLGCRLRHQDVPTTILVGRDELMDLIVSIAAAADRLDPSIAAFLDNFRDEHVPLRLSFAVVVAALALLAMLVAWAAVAWVRITRLRRLVRSAGKGAAFRDQAERVDAALSQSLFAATWAEYRECLKKEDIGILYLRHPGEYFGLHAIGGMAFPARFFAAVHGYFIGIGLLLTFIGLVAALKFAAAGVASADIAVAKQALNALLSAASFKFMTSIAGLGCSLLLSVAARTVTCGIENAAHGLAHDLEAAMMPVFVEGLAYDQLGATRAQLAALDKLNANLAPAVAREIEPRLGAALMPVIGAIAALPRPIVAALHELKDGIKPADGSELPQVLEGFATEMRRSAGVEIKQLAVQLAEVGAAIGQTQRHIGNSGHAFAEQMGAAASQLLSAAATMRESMDGRVNSVGDRIEQLAEALARNETRLAATATVAAQGMADTVKGAGDEIALRMIEATRSLAATSDGLAHRVEAMLGGLDKVGVTLDAQIDGMRQIVASLGGAKQALDESAGTWTRSSAPVVAAVDASHRVAHELSTVADRVVTAQRDMSDMAKAVTDISDKASHVWDSYRGRFEKVDDDLKAAFERLHEGTRSFNSEALGFVSTLDANLASGMQALSVGTDELREIAETLLAGAAGKAA
jgi:methyl-accepting chemotaxis protein